MSSVASFGRRLVPIVTALLLGGGLAAELSAQSLFAGRGLGFVMEPLDARSRGLGGIGLGLIEPNLGLVNPASIAGVGAPVLHVTLQPDQFSSTFDGVEVSGSTVRFPVIHAALPYGRWIASIGFASFLDRNWAVQRDTTLLVDGTAIDIRDRFASHGGVSRLRVGSTYAVTDRLALAAAVDVYSGSAADTTYRVFLQPGLLPTISSSSVSFRGTGYGTGLRWVPSQAIAFGASASAGGQLELRPATGAPAQSFDLPLQLAVGASGRVTPNTQVALSGRWSGWSSVDDGFVTEGGARDTWSVAGGVEWEAIRMGDRMIPLRLGARHALLPFRWNGDGPQSDWADERVLTLGTGLRLAGGAASLDAGLERGSRGGDQAGIDESFWRMAFSLTVFGR
jgi:hypothetical protein